MSVRACIDILHVPAKARRSEPIQLNLKWRSIGGAMPLPGRHGATFHSTWAAPQEAARGLASPALCGPAASKATQTAPAPAEKEVAAPANAQEAAAAFAGGADGGITLKGFAGGEYATAVALPVSLSTGSAMRAFPVRLRVTRSRVADGEWRVVRLHEGGREGDPLDELRRCHGQEARVEAREAQRLVDAPWTARDIAGDIA